MSKYTTNFHRLISGGFVTRSEIENIFKDYQLTDYLTQDEIDVIEDRGTWSKDKLAQKIVNHFYFTELGFETYAMFKHYAKEQMQEIMESKLPLIYSSSIEYDPLVNVDYKETLTRNTASVGSSSQSGTGLSISSDTPQTNISKETLLAGSYASNAGATEQEASGSNRLEGSESYTKSMKGNSGVSATAQKMVEQYRQNIRAIDYEIINELKDLFMGLF